MTENLLNVRPPLALLQLQALKKRKTLSSQALQYFQKLSSGYTGEKILAEKLGSNLSSDFIRLHGLQLEISGSETQIDCLILCQKQLFLLDSKHFSHEYIHDDKKWTHCPTKNIINNPIAQLARTENLMTQFLQHSASSFPLTSKLVFTHPNFILHHSSPDLPIIYPNQIEQFINRLNANAQAPRQFEKQIAQKLSTAHLPELKNAYKPSYIYDELAKGLFCEACDGKMKRLSLRQLSCITCGLERSVEASLKTNIQDFKYLFPDTPLTIKHVSDWINLEVSKTTLQLFLSKHYKLEFDGKASVYL